jgi:hypothetical protein
MRRSAGCGCQRFDFFLAFFFFGIIFVTAFFAFLTADFAALTTRLVADFLDFFATMFLLYLAF